MKTLKDIQDPFGHLEEGRVRELAIEWIKAFRKVRDTGGGNYTKEYYKAADDFEKECGVEIDTEYCQVDLDELFMTFFNITEEDISG